MGIGIIYWPPIMCAWEWFGDRKGLATGLIIGGFGFGAFIFGFVTTAIANPLNESRKVDPETGFYFFSEEVADRVPFMYRFCITCWFILLSVGIYLVQRNPEYMRHEIDRKLSEKLDRINESMDSEIESY